MQTFTCKPPAIWCCSRTRVLMPNLARHAAIHSPPIPLPIIIYSMSSGTRSRLYFRWSNVWSFTCHGLRDTLRRWRWWYELSFTCRHKKNEVDIFSSDKKDVVHNVARIFIRIMLLIHAHASASVIWNLWSYFFRQIPPGYLSWHWTNPNPFAMKLK